MKGNFTAEISPVKKDAVSNEATIKLLQGMLREAMAGNLRSIAVASVYGNGSITHAAGFDGMGDVVKLIAGTELVKNRLVEEINLGA